MGRYRVSTLYHLRTLFSPFLVGNVSDRNVMRMHSELASDGLKSVKFINREEGVLEVSLCYLFPRRPFTILR